MVKRPPGVSVICSRQMYHFLWFIKKSRAVNFIDTYSQEAIIYINKGPRGYSKYSTYISNDLEQILLVDLFS